jgi:hypothetical protein
MLTRATEFVRSQAHRNSVPDQPGFSDTRGHDPEWLKVSDAVRRFSIGRTSIYELIRNGSIKTALIRKRGNTLGCRLISTDSLRQYIESFVEAPAANDKTLWNAHTSNSD